MNNIGVLYSEVGEKERALEYYQQSMEVSEERMGPASAATSYRNMGRLLWETDRREQALELFERALELRRLTGNPYTVADSYWDLARVNMEEGNLQPAAVYIEEGSFLADSTGHPQLLADAAHWRGRLHYRREQYEAALEQFRRSWRNSRELPYTQRISPLIWLSNTFERLDSDSTLYYGRRAVDLIERNRERVGQAGGLRREFFRQYTGFYLSLAARTLDHTGSAADAYALVEASKARTLTDELQQAALRIDEQLPEEERLERSNRLNRLHRLYVERESTAGEAALDSLNGRIREEELSYTAYQNELAQTYPQYRELESPEPVTLAEAQSLSPPNSVILEYAVAGDKLLVFLISRREVVARSLDLREGDRDAGQVLSRLVQQFRDAILGQAPADELQRHSAPLMEALFDPIARPLGSYDRLMVVPDGPLAYLPFEALRRNNRYLIEDYTVKYIPSVTSLQLLNSPPQESRMDLLAVAGSDFSDLNAGSPAIPGRGVLSTLPSTLVEVDSIAGYFRNTTILKNAQVNEQAVKKSLNNTSYRYIHLATHGLIDEEQPAMSGLALGRSGELEAADLNDGMLRSSEIYRLKLNTEMVVLSACNTGVGPVVSGEGILGLQRSFFFAGAPTVVVSLWNVSDQPASYMMPLFYRELMNHPEESSSWWMQFSRWAGWNRSIPYGTAAHAMRQAKLNMIEHPLFNHPVNWAPFITVGR